MKNRFLRIPSVFSVSSVVNARVPRNASSLIIRGRGSARFPCLQLKCPRKSLFTPAHTSPKFGHSPISRTNNINHLRVAPPLRPPHAMLDHAVRRVRRHPARALLVIVTLGLGLGATTAIVSAIRGVLLVPLPYPHPEQLVMVK